MLCNENQPAKPYLMFWLYAPWKWKMQVRICIVLHMCRFWRASIGSIPQKRRTSACGHCRSESRQVLRALACRISSSLIWSTSQSLNSIPYSRVDRWSVWYKRVEILGERIRLFVKSWTVQFLARQNLDLISLRYAGFGLRLYFGTSEQGIVLDVSSLIRATLSVIFTPRYTPGVSSGHYPLADVE